MGRVLYPMLVASLPPLPSPDAAKELPISPLRLHDRLGMLQPADAAALAQIEAWFAWHHEPSEARASSPGSLEPELDDLDSDLSSVVRALREMRTLIAALRMRQRGAVAPDGSWGAANICQTVRHGYERPLFGLEHRFPFLPELDALIRAGDAAVLERWLADSTWQTLARAKAFHFFDFEAVALYVLRYRLLERLLGQDREVAVERFESLMSDALVPFVLAFSSSYGEEST